MSKLSKLSKFHQSSSQADIGTVQKKLFNPKKVKQSSKIKSDQELQEVKLQINTLASRIANTLTSEDLKTQRPLTTTSRAQTNQNSTSKKKKQSPYQNYMVTAVNNGNTYDSTVRSNLQNLLNSAEKSSYRYYSRGQQNTQESLLTSLEKSKEST